MSFLDCILAIFIGNPLMLFAYFITSALYQDWKARKLNICSHCPPSEDSYRSENRVNCFFEKLAEEKGINIDSFHEWKYAKDSARFIRVVHALGCEMVIRKVSDEDIEEELEED